MKTTTRYPSIFTVLMVAACFVISTQPSRAAHRQSPANPRGAAGVGTAGPGTAGRGAAGPGAAGLGTAGLGTAGRGTAGPGVADPHATARYTHALPASYETRAYRGLNYYYSDGAYYYAYSNDGPTIYVLAPVVNGVPTVPPRPYIYTMPAGYKIQSYGGVNYYYYYGYYYYVYYINGRAVYVLASVPGGTPTAPPQPY